MHAPNKEEQKTQVISDTPGFTPLNKEQGVGNQEEAGKIGLFTVVEDRANETNSLAKYP